MHSHSRKSLLLLPALLALSLASTTVLAEPKGGLPPGLQKKVERGGELPPGWEKKLRVGEVLDYDIYRYGRIVVPVDRDGVVTMEIEGHRLKLGVDTRRIVEILD